MTDHTPEPWVPANMPTGVEARQTDFWIVLGADDWLRARACVNACAGIPTEQLGDVKALVEALSALADKAASAMGDHVPAIVFARDALASFRED